ncbi:hypothetical protein FOZ62_015174, partial [Perkinsus olseni]
APGTTASPGKATSAAPKAKAAATPAVDSQQQQARLLEAVQKQQQQTAGSDGSQLAANSQHVARCFWHPTDPNQLRVDTGDVMMVKSVSPDGLWAWAVNVRTAQPQPGWVPTSVFNSPRAQQAQQQQQQQPQAKAAAMYGQASCPRSAMSELAAKLEAQRGGMVPVNRGGQQQQQQQMDQQLMVVAQSMRPGAPPVGTILQLDSVNPAA